MSGPTDVASAPAGNNIVPERTLTSQPLAFNTTLVEVLLAGAVLAGCGASLIAGQVGNAGPSSLQTIARAELDLAMTSLQPSAAAGSVEEARQCKTPLAYVTVRSSPGSGVQRIRLHSGSYVTPWLLLTDAPRRMAIPFPAPYLTGKGEIVVEAATHPVTIWLTPARTVGPQTGADHIPVVWATTNPCPP